jgi:hypothetical protein
MKRHAVKKMDALGEENFFEDERLLFADVFEFDECMYDVRFNFFQVLIELVQHVDMIPATFVSRPIYGRYIRFLGLHVINE